MRNQSRGLIESKDDIHESLRESRGMNRLHHLETAHYVELSQGVINRLNIVEHVWKSGDKLSKISFQYYQDASLWWIIARFNSVPTEGHISIGDVLQIPLNPEEITSVFLEQGEA